MPRAGSLGFCFVAALALCACRTAVVVAPKDPNMQTVVTVEQRPTTNPADKGLIIDDRTK